MCEVCWSSFREPRYIVSASIHVSLSTYVHDSQLIGLHGVQSEAAVCRAEFPFVCVFNTPRTSWTVRGSIPGGGKRFFSWSELVHTDTRSHPASFNVYRESFRGEVVNWSKSGVDHTPLFGTEVKERLELQLY